MTMRRSSEGRFGSSILNLIGGDEQIETATSSGDGHCRFVGRLHLRIVVPITSWQVHFACQFWWSAHLPKSSSNGLELIICRMPFRSTPLSEDRFQFIRLGILYARTNG